MNRRGVVLGSLAAAVPFRAARAQAAWPSKPVRFVVPFAAGGGTDTVSRLICDHLSKTFGQSFVVDNRGGAGGNIGTVEIAKSAPEGYTIGLISVASHTLNPMLYTKLPYDPDKDIIAISRVALLANLLGVTQSLPAGNVAELIALCKKEPGKYSFASSGPGTSLHLSGELFKAMAGVDIIHVPYKGAGPAYNDLIAGTVHMMFANMPSMLGQVRGGKLKGLGVTSAERSRRRPTSRRSPRPSRAMSRPRGTASAAPPARPNRSSPSSKPRSAMPCSSPRSRSAGRKTSASTCRRRAAPASRSSSRPTARRGRPRSRPPA